MNKSSPVRLGIYDAHHYDLLARSHPTFDTTVERNRLRHEKHVRDE